MSGAKKNKNVINKFAFPRKMVEPSATTAIHAGAPWSVPIPIWCQDSKYICHKSLAPAGVCTSAPPTSEPYR